MDSQRQPLAQREGRPERGIRFWPVLVGLGLGLAQLGQLWLLLEARRELETVHKAVLTLQRSEAQRLGL